VRHFQKPMRPVSIPRVRNGFAAILAVALLSFVAAAAVAQKAADGAAGGAAEPTLSTGFRFSEKSGEALYTNICQACHMPDGKGASGGGTYPALAGDQNLAARGYPVLVVVKGLHGMPPIGVMMNDDQVAAVVNYVRTHFGNHYQDAVTSEEVESVRP
jgi:mono/diheme cytochrome c family protein